MKLKLLTTNTRGLGAKNLFSVVTYFNGHPTFKFFQGKPELKWFAFRATPARVPIGCHFFVFGTCFWGTAVVPPDPDARLPQLAIAIATTRPFYDPNTKILEAHNVTT